MEQPFYGLCSGGVNGTLRSCYTYNRPLLSQCVPPDHLLCAKISLLGATSRSNRVRNICAVEHI
jgi:hypothetical protein